MKTIQLLLFALTVMLFANTTPQSEKLPWEKSLIRGKLKNGLKYTVVRTNVPRERAELRLYVGVGSLDEDDDQRGIAHMTEHMAFNGTKHFKKNELVSYLESIGMRFGGDLNAYTTYGHTVYSLSLPLRGEHLDKCLTILRDWAGDLNFSKEEFEKERGVILEEKRLRDTADNRLITKATPLIYTNHRYAERITIGLEEIIRHIPHDRARAFYDTWYRPEFMHVVAVGDFNATAIEYQIKEKFSDLKNSHIEKRVSRLMIDRNETIVATLSDKELTSNMVQIIYGIDTQGIRTVGEKREALIEGFAQMLFRLRAEEQILKADPKALNIALSVEMIAPNRKIYNFVAIHKKGHAKAALKELYAMMWGFAEYGFSQNNLDLAKKRVKSEIEKAYRKIHTLRADVMAEKLVSGIIADAISIDYDYDYNLTNRLIDNIRLEEINHFFENLLKTKERTILFKNMSNKGADKNSTLALMEEAKKDADNMSQSKKLPSRILDNNLTARPFIARHHDMNLDIYRYTLPNGITVDFKYSVRQKNMIHLQASSVGGTSALPVNEMRMLNYTPEWIDLSAPGRFTLAEIKKILSGKQISIAPSVNRFSDDIKASCSSFDAESMFELLYAKVTEAKLDKRVFENGKRHAKTAIRQIAKEPHYLFSKKVIGQYYKNNPRLRPATIEEVDALKREKVLEIYKKRFSDMNHFYFAIVGDIKRERLEELISIYLANLPTEDRNETYSTEDYSRLPGQQLITAHYNRENRAELGLEYHADIPYSLENTLLLESMVNILNIRLRNMIREERSGTYNINVSEELPGELKNKATFRIAFKADPKRAKELIETAKNIIADFTQKGPTPQEINTYKETAKVSLKNALTYNVFWTQTMVYAHRMHIPMMEMLDIDNRLNMLTPENIREIAKIMFGGDLLQTELLPVSHK